MKTVSARFDRGEITVLAARVATLAVGPITVLAIGVFFSPVLQGYYYSFTSIVAASQLFEAGISTAVIQMAAHASGQIRFTPDAIESNDPSALRRLAGVFRFALAWYGGIAVGMALIVTAIGVVVFTGKPSTVDWFLPWVLLVVLAAADLALQAFFVVLEGTGHIVEAYRYRLVRVVALNLALVVAVAAGAQLFALAIGIGAAVVVGIAHVLHRRRFFSQLSRIPARGAVRWSTDILPFQWRVAVTWMAGYLSAAAFTPLLLVTRGPVEAGQMGMTVLLTTACTSLAASFIQAKAPQLGSLAGGERWGELIQTFRAKAVRSIVVAGGVLTCATLAVIAAQALDIPLADRILAWPLFLVLALGRMAYHVEGVFAFFMRAQMREPYFVLEVLGAALIVPAALASASPWGALGLCAAFTAVHLVLLLPAAAAILRKDLVRVRTLAARASSPLQGDHPTPGVAAERAPVSAVLMAADR